MTITELSEGANLLPERRSIDERFQEALSKPPIRGLLYGSGGWTREFKKLNRGVDDSCKREEVCGHGLDHGIHVAKNALVASSLIASPSAREGTILQDSSVVFVSLVHDLGYSDPTITWENKYALGHEKKSIGYMDRMKKRIRIIFPVGSSAGLSLSDLDRNFDAYSRAIQSTSDDPKDQEKLMQVTESSPTSEKLLQLVIAFADAADLFRESRLDRVPPPTTYKDNPYYFLCKVVKKYKLSVEDGKLIYGVELQRGWDLARWQEAGRANRLSSIFTLGDQVANAAGHEFEVRNIPAPA